MASGFNKLNQLVWDGVPIDNVTVDGGRPTDDGIIPPHGTPVSPRSEAAAKPLEDVQHTRSPFLDDANGPQSEAAKHVSSLVSSVLSGKEFDAAIDWSLNNVKEIVGNASIDILEALRTIYTEAPEDFISTDTQVLKLLSKVLELFPVPRVEKVTSAIAEGGPFAIAIFKAERMLLNEKMGSLANTQSELVAIKIELGAARRDIEGGLTADEAEEFYDEAGKLEERAEYAEKKLEKMRRLQREMGVLQKAFEEEQKEHEEVQKEHEEVLRVKELEKREARRAHVKDHAHLMEEIRGLKRKREDEKVEATVKLAKAEKELLRQRKLSEVFALLSGVDQ